jgi:hypothetical protein
MIRRRHSVFHIPLKIFKSLILSAFSAVQDYCLTGKNHLSLSNRQMDLKGVIQQD